MAVAIVNQTTATQTDTDPVVRVSPTAGNWLVVVVSWHTNDRTLPTLAVGDLARNHWRRLGQKVNTDRFVGVEIWACPNVAVAPRTYTDVYVTVADISAPDVGRVAVNVVEVSGLSNWVTIDSATTGETDTGTTLSISMPAPTEEVMSIAAMVAEDDDTTLSVTSAGWTDLTTVTVANSVEIEQLAMWRVTSGAQTASWSSSANINLAGLVVAFHTVGEAPAQASANWPAIQAQMGFGFDSSTPLPAVEWTGMNDRFQQMRTVRGIPYELGQAQAGETTLIWTNRDGALTPRATSGQGTAAGAGSTTHIVPPDSQAAGFALSDFAVIKRSGVPLRTVTGDYAVRVTAKASAFGFTNVSFTPALTVATATNDTITGLPLDLYSPTRVLATWNGRTYPVYTGQTERMTERWTSPVRGIVDATGIDSLGTLQADALSALRGEILRRSPHSYWPLDDAAGSGGAANIARRDGGVPLVQVVTKYGAGSAKADFGASTQSVEIQSASDINTSVHGDPGSGWRQELPYTESTKGYCLLAYSDDFPSLAGGVTLFGVVGVPDDPALDDIGAYEPAILSIKNIDPGGAGAMVRIRVRGGLDSRFSVTAWDKDTHTPGAIWTSTASVAGPTFQTFALTLTQTSLSWYSNGLFETTNSPLDLAANFNLISIGGETDAFATGNCCAGTFCHFAIFDRVLSSQEIGEIGLNGFLAYSDGVEQLNARLKRKLAVSGWTGARGVSPSATVVSQDAGLEGQSTAGVLSEIVSWDDGMVFADAGGYLRYLSGAELDVATSRYTFGEDTATGEIPYQLDSELDYDPSHLRNDIKINNRSTTWYSETGTAVTASDEASIRRYRQRPLSRDTRLQNSEDAFHLAWWLLGKYGTAKLRVKQITVDPTAYPTAWPVVLGVEVGDRITVKRRPLGAPEITLECVVLQIKHDVSSEPTRWQTTLTLAVAPPNVLILNHATKGIVGTNTMGR